MAPISGILTLVSFLVSTARRLLPCPARRQRLRLPIGSDVKRSDGAGEGIRTLDPNLGKVVLYP